MKTMQDWFDAYGVSHKNHTNKTIHWICVPLIFFSIVGLIWSIPHQILNDFVPVQPEQVVNWATLILLLVLVYYFILSVPLFFGMLIVAIANIFVCYLVDVYVDIPLWLISIVVFVLAWIGQFYGHNIEGKKPSFFKDLQFLLIGPAWLMHFIYKRFGFAY